MAKFTANDFMEKYLSIPLAINKFEENLLPDENMFWKSDKFFLEYGNLLTEYDLQEWFDTLPNQGYNIRLQEAIDFTLEFAEIILAHPADYEYDKGFMLQQIYHEWHQQLVTSFLDVLFKRYLVKKVMQGNLDRDLTKIELAKLDFIEKLDSFDFETLEESEELLNTMPIFV